MHARRMLIILGASGTVGRYLFDQAVASGRECRGTYFSRAAPDLEYFDMSNLQPHILDQLCAGVSHGIITAGIKFKSPTHPNTTDQSFDRPLIGLDLLVYLVSVQLDKYLLPILLTLLF